MDGIRQGVAGGVPRRAGWYVQTLRLTACALLAWLVWQVWHLSTYEAADVVWVCDGTGSCGTDHFASVGPFAGIAAAIGLGIAAARYLHRSAPGAVVALSAWAALAGWQDALADGKVTRADTSAWFLLVPVELPVPTWLAVLRWLTAAALAGACCGAFSSLYRTAAVARFLRGRACAPGTLEGWRSLGRRHGEADLLFADERGVRHRVPVVVARRALTRETVLAVYDPARPGDAARTRAALPRKEARP
ncbi:hypothetical protein AB0F32_28125 [Streptomyces albidoflavus]|uniref:Uncharacterized protein n=1 Tax=Streptomyces albidoflavus TaxID=1886 RepID=A0A8G1ZXM0_9ACTN|nr:hypothetical protein [Streptomyces albidoflavus]KUL57789.1 hypothetical protein ADL32_24625 [Streptomyces albidoflavus]RZE24009.1 hypothetical protein C0Q92_14695 [Streptomyces albidoflavus]RZE44241.1 hypothetical protein C0Q95_13780 [Streptomyces albidoflavus]WSU16226.1 hypothetical protein OG330_14590 [Streptomyces albidoflavus]WTC30374.1 hypothetical protein OH749_14635 [Streptomyces albidoflavus]